MPELPWPAQLEWSLFWGSIGLVIFLSTYLYFFLRRKVRQERLTRVVAIVLYLLATAASFIVGCFAVIGTSDFIEKHYRHSPLVDRPHTIWLGDRSGGLLVFGFLLILFIAIANLAFIIQMIFLRRSRPDRA
jgi:TRAP-type C4-dicarboxylate transport system permease small subunit